MIRKVRPSVCYTSVCYRSLLSCSGSILLVFHPSLVAVFFLFVFSFLHHRFCFILRSVGLLSRRPHVRHVLPRQSARLSVAFAAAAVPTKLSLHGWVPPTDRPCRPCELVYPPRGRGGSGNDGITGSCRQHVDGIGSGPAQRPPTGSFLVCVRGFHSFVSC